MDAGDQGGPARPATKVGATMHTKNVGPIADEILAAIDGPSQIATFTERDPSFRIEHAQATLAELRKKRTARGERPVGRKIGFTNRTHLGRVQGLRADLGHNVRHHRARIVGVAERFSAGALLRAAHRAGDRVQAGEDAEAGHGRSRHCSIASNGSRTASRSCNRFFPAGSSPARITVAAEGLHGALLLGPRAAVASPGRM